MDGIPPEKIKPKLHRGEMKFYKSSKKEYDRLLANAKPGVKPMFYLPDYIDYDYDDGYDEDDYTYDDDEPEESTEDKPPRPDPEEFYCPVYDGMIILYDCGEISACAKSHELYNDGLPPLMEKDEIIKKADLCLSCPRNESNQKKQENS